VLKDLNNRLRYRSARDVVMGVNDLLRYSGRSLDVVNNAMGLPLKIQMRSNRPRHINSAGTSGLLAGQQTISAGGDACIVEDGARFVRRPLSSYQIQDIELLEVYDKYGDESHTLEHLFTGSCMRDAEGKHPLWYVVWLKGRDR